MEDRLIKWNNYLLVPVAVVALVAGLVSVYKETCWYIYLPLFTITLTLVVLAILKKKEIHEFEVVWQEMTIDLLDNLGQDAVFTNYSKLKALKQGAHNFDYVLYCDGEIEKITTKDGSIGNITREGGRFVVKTNIECPINKGDQIEHTLSAKYLNGFTKKNEYWQTTKNAPGAKIKITVLTTLDRPIRNYKAFKIIGHTKILLSQQPKRIVTGKKQGIVFDFEQAKFLEKYRLEWTW